MHKYLKIILIVIAGCYLINLLGCSSHPCVGKWHGSYIRSYDVRETWDITINKEGTCIAREIGSGGANYEENYKGTWETVSDEIIYMYLESEPRSRKMTYSQSEIENEAAKAQTPWARKQAFSKTNKYKTEYRSEVERFYLRSDGAMEAHVEWLDNAKLKMSKE